MSILIKDITYLSDDYSTWKKGHILIDGNKISKIGSFSLDEIKADETVCGNNKIVIPGLINSHTHSYTGYLKGSIDNVPLDIYMLYAIAQGSHRTERQIYISSALEALNMLKRGITSAVDHLAQRPSISEQGVSASAQGFKDLGMRAKIATMFADKSFFETVPMFPGELPESCIPKSKTAPQTVDNYIQQVETSFLKFKDDELIDIMLGTDGPQRCSEQLLTKTALLEEKYKMGWHSHILEAKTQAIVAKKRFGKGLIEYMDSLGIINSRTNLVHHVWVSENELNIVRDRKATVIHCPFSNLHLGAGIAPVAHYHDFGIDIALGSDGGNCGSVSMFDQMKLLATVQNVSTIDYEKWFSAEDTLKLMYTGGKKVLGKDVGVLSEGKLADMVVLDIDNVFWQPLGNISRQLVYYENGSSVDMVIVNGKKVIENGKSTMIDEAQLIQEAKEIAQKLKQDSEDSLRFVQKQIPYFKAMHLRESKKDIGFERLIDFKF